MRLYRIIKKPLVTEKAANLEMNNSCYVVEVSSDATKIDIKKAVQELYGVDVATVNTLTTRAKSKYGRKGMQIKRRETKKAYVTLKDKSAKLDLSLVK